MRRDGWTRGFAVPWVMLAMGAVFAAWQAEAAPFAYVVNVESGSVSVIDIATNSVVATIPAGNPLGIAATPDGKLVYVANVNPDFSGTVLAIDTVSNTGVSTIAVGMAPFELTVAPDGKHVYVGNRLSNTLSVINTATSTVVATIPVGQYPGGVAVAPDGMYVYAANQDSGTVSVIEAAKNSVVATVPVGPGPWGIAFAPDGKHIYVAIQSASVVAVIETASNTVVATVPVGGNPLEVAVTPDGQYAYVTNLGGGTVSVIDLITNTVAATVPVGPFPWGIAVAPDGKHVYVGHFEASDTVSVIETATETVVATIPLEHSPALIAIVTPPCTSKDASLVNKKFPVSGTMTYEISSPSRVLQSITLTASTNINSSTLPTISGNGHSAAGGVFVKADPSAPATFDLQAAFVTPAYSCIIDPLTTTLQVDEGRTAVQNFNLIPKSEHFIDVVNGTPGLNALHIEVNGKPFRTLNLWWSGTARVDASAAMTLETNTLTFTGQGRPGSFANIDVTDTAPSSARLPRSAAGIWGRRPDSGSPAGTP